MDIGRIIISTALVAFTLSTNPSLAVDLNGSVTTEDGTPVCALAIASGRSMFTCEPVGKFRFTDLPVEPDGSINLQVYADGYVQNFTNLTEFGPQQVVMQAAQQCDNPGTGTNKEKTERLIGRWFFQYTIISTFDDIYWLPGPAEPSDAFPGDFNLFGFDTFGNADVLASYNSELGQYMLLDLGSILIDSFFVFDFTSADTVSGCYFQVDKGTTDLGRCYPLSGSRTPSIAAAIAAQEESGVRRGPGSEAAREATLVQEVEVHTMARASLASGTAASAEEAQERLRAQGQYLKLREALLAR